MPRSKTASGDLKERTLGAEVFGRDPRYDTNADPVVRVSAGEVRKRIAQYYHENGHASRVQIELPLGSYAPEFQLREPDAANTGAYPERLTSPGEDYAPVADARLLIRPGWRFAAGERNCGISLPSGLGDGRGCREMLWDPLVQASRPVLIVVGTTHPGPDGAGK